MPELAAADDDDDDNDEEEEEEEEEAAEEADSPVLLWCICCLSWLAEATCLWWSDAFWAWPLGAELDTTGGEPFVGFVLAAGEASSARRSLAALSSWWPALPLECCCCC